MRGEKPHSLITHQLTWCDLGGGDEDADGDFTCSDVPR